MENETTHRGVTPEEVQRVLRELNRDDLLKIHYRVRHEGLLFQGPEQSMLGELLTATAGDYKRIYAIVARYKVTGVV